jgi:hypothetical protein
MQSIMDNVRVYQDFLAQAGRADASSLVQNVYALCPANNKRCFWIQRGSLQCALESDGLALDKPVDHITMSVEGLRDLICSMDIAVDRDCDVYAELPEKPCNGFVKLQQGLAKVHLRERWVQWV